MSNTALEVEERQTLTRTDSELLDHDRFTIRTSPGDLVISPREFLRYADPPAETAFPLEYAFHLLGDVRGKTVVDLGSGDGLNTAILASLGAKVISLQYSNQSVEMTTERVRANNLERDVTLILADVGTIPVRDGSADRVLSVSMFREPDCVATARRIRRVLKPGGVAAFLSPVTGPDWFCQIKSFLPPPDSLPQDERALAADQIEAVTRAVGRGGRLREFTLITRVLERIGVRCVATIRNAHKLDAWILRHFAGVRALASPWVWEAYKEH